jgi:hypothetical protein
VRQVRLVGRSIPAGPFCSDVALRGRRLKRLFFARAHYLPALPGDYAEREGAAFQPGH